MTIMRHHLVKVTYGLRRYNRFSFGRNAASEIFENAIYQRLHGLKGKIIISDDILVFSKSQNKHDTNLNAVLNRLQENRLTSNAKNSKFNTKKIFVFNLLILPKLLQYKIVVLLVMLKK